MAKLDGLETVLNFLKGLQLSSCTSRNKPWRMEFAAIKPKSACADSPENQEF